jgi:hypothetical protein
MALHYTRREITNLFQTKLKPRLEAMEEERLAIKSSGIKSFILSAIIIYPLFYYIVAEVGYRPRDSEAFLIPIILPFFIAAYAIRNKIKPYRKKYKEQIVKEIFDIVLPGSKIEVEQHISEDTFRKSRIITNRIDRFDGNDLITSKHKGVQFQFSDVHAEESHRDKNGNKRYTTIFQGIFFHCVYPKPLINSTVVVPDLAEKYFGKVVGGWMQKMNASRKDPVRLESPEFEKKYAVYGGDQIEARKILTPAIMARILQFNKKTGKLISLSFLDGRMFVAIPAKKDHFEPSIWHTGVRFKDITEMVLTLELITGLIEEFIHMERKEQSA